MLSQAGKKIEVSVATYLGVWDTQEWQLEQEIEQESNHAGRSYALIIRDHVWDVLEAWPDGAQKDFHALAASGSLNTTDRSVLNKSS